MSGETVKVMASDGEVIEYFVERFNEGQMKDAHWTVDGKRVVLWYKRRPDAAAIDRLEMIIGEYRDKIFNREGGDYWKDLFCWPTAIVRLNDKVGIVVPAYAANFLFEFGNLPSYKGDLKGASKVGKWFTTPRHRARTLDRRELGDWLNNLRICLKVARAVGRLHAAGLAHSDLSYNNVLVDPRTGGACVIDVDGLVVPGRYPPDVVGTPDFIAPEVVRTAHLAHDDPARKLPKRETDQHALAVLVYMYLLCRHPLRGDRVLDIDDDVRDELLMTGEKALFVEHKTDTSNRIKASGLEPFDRPWRDCTRLPYTVTGPHLSALFEGAFVNGLHDPRQRPGAGDWEQALVKTIDLLQPCRNSACEQKWFVFNDTTRPSCPFCGTSFTGVLPILNLYSSRQSGSFRPDNHRLMVWSGQSLSRWHTNAFIAPNEKLQQKDKRRVGYFQFHQSRWHLVNEALPDLAVVGDGARPIPVGSSVELVDRLQLLFERAQGGRLAVVQVVSS